MPHEWALIRKIHPTTTQPEPPSGRFDSSADSQVVSFSSDNCRVDSESSSETSV
jgi:hypothetical protein